MTTLVFLEPNRLDAEPFTTSDVVASFAGVQHHAIQQILNKHESDFKEFGTLAFEMRVCSHRTGASSQKICRLNEEQATLLVTYLKNTERVRAFKKELVRQFFAMRAELMKRQICRAELKPIRRELTDVIKEADTSKWAFKKYTDLAYKAAVGKNAAQLRKERRAPQKAHAVDYLTSKEIESVTKREGQIAVLLELGMDYEQVKALVLDRRLVGSVANAAPGQDSA